MYIPVFVFCCYYNKLYKSCSLKQYIFKRKFLLFCRIETQNKYCWAKIQKAGGILLQDESSGELVSSLFPASWDLHAPQLQNPRTLPSLATLSDSSSAGIGSLPLKSPPPKTQDNSPILWLINTPPKSLSPQKCTIFSASRDFDVVGAQVRTPQWCSGWGSSSESRLLPPCLVSLLSTETDSLWNSLIWPRGEVLNPPHHHHHHQITSEV